MKKQLFATLGVGVLGVILSFSSGIRTSYAADNSAAPFTSSVKQLIRDGALVSRHRRTGKVSFIGFSRDRAPNVPGIIAGRSVDDNARAALASFGAMFGIGDPSTDLRLARSLVSPDGRSMARYQQLYQGIPVIGGEIIVNMDSQGRLSSINGEALPNTFIDTVATVSASEATDRALSAVARYHDVSPGALVATETELSIYAPSLIGPDHMAPMLVWKLEIYSDTSKPIDEFVLVHARRGHIALHFNQVHTAKNRTTHNGSSVTGPSQLPGPLLCNEADGDACTSGAVPDADAAHQHAGDTYDFYLTNHGRDSIDGSGMALVSTVNLNVLSGVCPNAFWYSPSNQMVYCSGLPQGDDVVAHELTHGVTDRTSKLLYYYQSGAINESLSDVWGEFIDQTNGRGNDSAGVKWLLGEDASIGVIRSMADPTLYGDPDRMSSGNYYTASSDSGGVHTNSGINNKAAYLMVDGSVGEVGGVFNGRTINAMGIPKVAKIYYEVQTRFLTSGSDYLDLHNALYQGCLNLVGTSGITNSDCDNVREATLAVEMDQDPASFNPEASICPAGQAPSNLFFDDFENGIGQWIFSGTNSSIWAQDSIWTGPYATSGMHSLYADDLIPNNHTYATMNTGITIPPGGLQLHFNQAFGFDSPANGGARLLYSIDGGAFQDAGSLFQEGQDYNGIISSGALATNNGFINDSHGYVSSRYEITTNVGQSIRFRFELATGTLWNQGWWIDDVRLYTCIPNTAPTAPTLLGPADGTTDVDSALVTFTWDPASDIDGDTLNYRLEVCTDAGFSSCTVDITKGNASNGFLSAAMGGGLGLGLIALLVAGRNRRLGLILLTIAAGSMIASCGGGGATPPASLTFDTTSLNPGTTYFWRVTADDGNGGSTPSVEWSFTTLP